MTKRPKINPPILPEKQCELVNMIEEFIQKVDKNNKFDVDFQMLTTGIRLLEDYLIMQHTTINELLTEIEIGNKKLNNPN